MFSLPFVRGLIANNIFSFGQDWARLTKDLLFDSEGRLSLKPELWNDIRRTILPAIVDKVGYMPLPRIEYTDDSFDLVVENLVLSGRNTFPNMVEFETKNYVKFSPYNSELIAYILLVLD